MTEAEWLGSVRPDLMVMFLRGPATTRKLRLLACGCCRRHWGRIRDPEVRRKVEVTEGYADGTVPEPEFTAAFPSGASPRQRGQSFIRAIGRAVDQFGWREEPTLLWHGRAPASAAAAPSPPSGRWKPGEYAEMYTLPILFLTAYATTRLNREEDDQVKLDREHAAQADLVRCLFGNPFRPVTVSPAWLTPTVRTLAEQMYESRGFSPMPILADALQDAGCEDDQLLSHCRSGGAHARGCWVVDLVLGKT